MELFANKKYDSKLDESNPNIQLYCPLFSTQQNSHAYALSLTQRMQEFTHEELVSLPPVYDWGLSTHDTIKICLGTETWQLQLETTGADESHSICEAKSLESNRLETAGTDVRWHDDTKMNTVRWFVALKTDPDLC